MYNKPFKGKQLNWTHSLCRNLVFCSIMNEHVGVPFELVKHASASFIDAPEWRGEGLFFNGTNADCQWSNSNFPDSLFLGELTLMWRGYVTQFGGHWLSKTTSGGGTQTPFNFATYTETNTYLYSVRSNNTAFRAWRSTAVISLNQYCHFAVVHTANIADEPIFYINGKPSTGLSLFGGTGTGAATGNNAPIRTCENESGGSFYAGTCENIFIFNRRLSQAEIISFYLEPYSMFDQPSRAKYFFIPAAGGLSTRRVWSPTNGLFSPSLF